MRLDRTPGVILDVEGHDILPRAAPLHCLADASDPAIRALVETIGPWMPRLVVAASRAEMEACVAEHRPDIVLLGRDAGLSDVQALCQGVRTQNIGVALLQTPEAARKRFPALLDGVPHRLEMDAIHPSAGVTEIVLRLRSLLRRSRPLGLSQRRTIGDITLDEASLTLTMKGVSAPVPLNGYRLIAPMFDLPDHVWRPEELHSIAYGSTTRTHPDLVRVALSRVRKSLAERLDRDPVQTVRGAGYRLAFVS